MSGHDDLALLFANNAAWARQMRAGDPEFFARLTHQQSPKYLWIGCSDSRVPANEIIGLPPGEVFVHRNVANLVVADDLNGLSALQFGIDVLRVQHVIVCGHYKCSGVQAVFDGHEHGLVDRWLSNIENLRHEHEAELALLPGRTEQASRLCELNVIAQVGNVCRTDSVTQAWARDQEVAVHGWIYDVADGLLHDLHVTATGKR